MKKTFSVVYTVCVVVILLGVIAYFGWDTYQSRAGRINDFQTRAGEYTRRLAVSLAQNRDVNSEVKIAEGLMDDDPSLLAVQVFSHDDGLRLSVVKPAAGEFNRSPIVESDHFDSPFARIRYEVVTVPMNVEDMQGLEAVFVAATLSGAEIRNNLMIILITVAGLFAITLVLILIRPGRRDENDDFEEDYESTGVSAEMNDAGDESFSMHSIEDDFKLPDFGDEDRLDDSDLLGSNPDVAETLTLDDDFKLPDLDDIPSEAPGSPVDPQMIARLDLELERAASFNQDLSLLVFSAGGISEGRIRDFYNYDDLVFTLGDGGFAVIEINKDLDSTLAATEDFIRGRISETGSRVARAGIASRNGRLISAERLFSEAAGALRRTDDEKNIVAFRSDPEKYREFLKNQNG